MHIGLILAAGGSGQRFGGDMPKQYVCVHDRPIYVHALSCFSTLVHETVIVAAEAWHETIANDIRQVDGLGTITVTTGAADRQGSVMQGLQTLTDRCDLVLVHDAARPWVAQADIKAVIASLQHHDAAVLAAPCVNTLKRVDSSLQVVETPVREEFYMALTPQGFRYTSGLQAYAQVREDGFQATDDAAVLAHGGFAVQVVPGDPRNIKVTNPADVDMMAAVLRH